MGLKRCNAYYFDTCFSFMSKILRANKKVNAFVTINGMLLITIPYSNHNPTPAVNMVYMPTEIPERSLVRHDLIA